MHWHKDCEPGVETGMTFRLLIPCNVSGYSELLDNVKLAKVVFQVYKVTDDCCISKSLSVNDQSWSGFCCRITTIGLEGQGLAAVVAPGVARGVAPGRVDGVASTNSSNQLELGCSCMPKPWGCCDVFTVGRFWWSLWHINWERTWPSYKQYIDNTPVWDPGIESFQILFPYWQERVFTVIIVAGSEVDWVCIHEGSFDTTFCSYLSIQMSSMECSACVRIAALFYFGFVCFVIVLHCKVCVGPACPATGGRGKDLFQHCCCPASCRVLYMPSAVGTLGKCFVSSD